MFSGAYCTFVGEASDFAFSGVLSEIAFLAVMPFLEKAGKVVAFLGVKPSLGEVGEVAFIRDKASLGAIDEKAFFWEKASLFNMFENFGI